MNDLRRKLSSSALLFCGVLLLTGISVAAENDRAVQALARKSGGSWSVGLRDAFLKQARQEMLQKATVSKETIAWVDSSLVARQAVYGSVSPADPRILENLDQLREELGPELFDKYQQFCLGAAVARRKFGVGPIANARINLKFGYLFKWIDEVEQAGHSPSEALASQEASELLAEGSPEKQAYGVVKGYLDEKSLTPKKAYQSEQHKAALESLLAKATPRIKSPERALPKILRQWMVEEGTRPVARSECPSVAEYLKFLDKIYSIPKSELSLEASQKWPIYPLEESPWPILMPLSMTWPLDEAQYIWEKYQGQHGKKRMHTYGPYKRFPLGVPPSLEESPWHLEAWPSAISTGGLCGTMSSIANGTYTALGVPIIKAGQPRHSCIVRYDVNEKGEYSAGIGQSATGGTAETSTPWLFADGPIAGSRGTYGVGSVYHFGLTQGMNVGVTSYMDTRIAVHIYKALPENDRSALGANIVKGALLKNPCNLEAWYLLGRDARNAQELLQVLNGFDRLLESKAMMEQQEDRDATSDLGEDKVNPKTSVDSKIATLRHTGMEEMLQLALQDLDRFSVKDVRAIGSHIHQEVNKGEVHLKALRDRCIWKVLSIESVQAGISRDLQTFLNSPPKGRRAVRVAGTYLFNRIDQVTDLMDDRSQREAWLKSLLDDFTPAQKVIISKKDGRQLNRYFVQVSDLLTKSLKARPANKTALKELQTLHHDLLEPSN